MARKMKDVIEENEQLKERIDRLTKESYERMKEEDALFERSHLKSSMARDIETQKFYVKMAEDNAKWAEERVSKMARQVKDILADNKELAQAHDVDYWIGISQRKSFDEKEVDQLKKEILELQGEIQAKDNQIRYLKNHIEHLIYEGSEGYKEESFTPVEEGRRKGRPAEIDEGTKKRVRKLRKEGYSYRKIAEVEGISFSSVRNIIQEGAKKKANA